MNTFLLIFPDLNQFQTYISIATFLVTALTAGAIIGTFGLQNRILGSQMEVQRMEALNSRIKLMPKVNVHISDDWHVEGETPMYVYRSLFFNIEDNCIKDIQINFDNGVYPGVSLSGPITSDFDKYKSKVWLPGEKVEIGLRFLVLSMDDFRNGVSGHQSDVSLTYCDLMNNQYKTAAIVSAARLLLKYDTVAII